MISNGFVPLNLTIISNSRGIWIWNRIPVSGAIEDAQCGGDFLIGKFYFQFLA